MHLCRRKYIISVITLVLPFVLSIAQIVDLYVFGSIFSGNTGCSTWPTVVHSQIIELEFLFFLVKIRVHVLLPI